MIPSEDLPKKNCPIPPVGPCMKEMCMWYCPGDKECCVKVIAIQLIKLEEKEG